MAATELFHFERLFGAGQPAAEIFLELCPVELFFAANFAEFFGEVDRFFGHSLDYIPSGTSSVNETPAPIRRGRRFSRSLRAPPSRPLAQLAARDGLAMHFVGTVGDSERAAVAPEARDREVVAHPRRSIELDRAVEHLHHHVRAHH